jgi:hypothetical protein
MSGSRGWDARRALEVLLLVTGATLGIIQIVRIVRAPPEVGDLLLLAVALILVFSSAAVGWPRYRHGNPRHPSLPEFVLLVAGIGIGTPQAGRILREGPSTGSILMLSVALALLFSSAGLNWLRHRNRKLDDAAHEDEVS